MMSINQSSAASYHQPASHFTHYSSAPSFAYSSTMQGRPSHIGPDGRTSDSSSRPTHLPSLASPPSQAHHVPVSGTSSPFYSESSRTKAMAGDADPMAATPTSPLLSRRRKRSHSGDAVTSENDRDQGKEDGAGAGNVTMFQCRGFGDCQMVFTRSEHLARHVRKHTGERPFQCHCGKAFSRLDNLRQHAQTVHADEQERNEIMMQDLTSLHSTLAANAAQAQVAHAQVLSKPLGGAPVGQSNAVHPASRRKSSVTVKGASTLAKKRHSIVAKEGRRDSTHARTTPPTRLDGRPSSASPHGYFADQRDPSPTSNGAGYYHTYSSGAAGPAPEGHSASAAHGFQYSRPPSSSGPYSAFASSAYTPSAPESGHYSSYGQTPASHYTGSASTHAAYPPAFGAQHDAKHHHYDAYQVSPPPFHQTDVVEWRGHELGPRGEDYYSSESNPIRSNFQSTLSAHLAMRTPILRPGRAFSPPPSTAHSGRPTSSSSMATMDRPVLPPLSSLSRPGTAHSTNAAPAPAGFAANGSRRPSLMDSNGHIPALPGLGDDRRPYTSPADQHLSTSNGRPTLPSVSTTTTGGMRPSSRGTVMDQPSMIHSTKGTGRLPPHTASGSMTRSYSRPSSSAGHGDPLAERLRTSPPSSHSPFHFQPPPLPGPAATTALAPLSSSGTGAAMTVDWKRPVSRDRVSFGALPSLSNTLDSLKRSREAGPPREKRDECAVKRHRPFTSGDLPAPPKFGVQHGKDSGEGLQGARRVSIASLVDAVEGHVKEEEREEQDELTAEV